MEREFAGQCALEQVQLLVHTHPPKQVFDVKERCGTPSLFLITRAPAPDATGFRFDARHHAFDQIRRPETGAEFDNKLDVVKIRPLARMGYFDYTSVESVFTMPPSGPGLEERMAGLEGRPTYDE